MNRFQTIPRFVVTYGVADSCLAVASLFRRDPPPPTGLDHLFPGSKKIWTSSGRQALWLMLKALNLPPGAGVAVPLYSDFAVIQTVAACNLTPVFVDIDEQTLTMSPASLSAVRDRVSAIIAVHLFGHVAPILELQRAVPDVPLIEDTVHAPLSYLGDKLVGTMGVGCFYSCGSSKCWPAGGGGIAVINDERLVDSVLRDSATFISPSFKERLWNVLYQSAKSALFRKSTYGAFGRPLRPRMERYALLEPDLDVKAIQPGQAVVALRQMKSYEDRAKRQRENGHRLLSALRHVPDLILPYERPGTEYSYHFFPVLLSGSAERESVARSMLAKSVDTSQVYFNVVSEARRVGYTGGCPVAEGAAQRMMTLPNYAGLSRWEVAYIAEVFIDALEEYRSHRRPNAWAVGAAHQSIGVN